MVGLYAAMPALVLYALVGSSRHLVVSPMSATAALSLGVVSTITDDAGEFVVLTAGLALATGLAALLAGVLRLGFLAAFISEPVLKGFIIGLALTIMIGQVPALIGVDKGSGNFFEKLWDLLQQLGDAQALATVVGLAQPRRAPRPAPLGAAGPGLPGGGGAGHRRGRGVRAGRPRPGDRRDHRLRPPVRRAAGRQPLRLPRAVRCRDRRDAGRLRRGSGRRQDLRRPGGLRHRHQPRAAGAGCGQRGCGPDQRHGRERQPVEDRRQRQRRGPVAALRY